MIENLFNVNKIRAFNDVSACLIQNTDIYCWGEIDPSPSNIPIPLNFEKGKITDISDFKLGAKHFIILSSGGVYTIGNNKHCALGLKSKK